MICKRYRIAGKVVEIRSRFENVHTRCADYETGDAADYTAEVTQEHVEKERRWYTKSDKSPEENAARLPDSFLEELAVHRMLAETLIEYDTVLFHGSCIAVDGTAYLFAAPSGTGKSTHARLWRELLGERAVMVNDDKPMLHIGETVTAFGSPWNGKERLGENISAPLKAICFLSRAEENRIERASAPEIYPQMMFQIYRPKNPELMQKTLALTDRLLERVSLYRLACNMDPAVAELSFGVMSGKEPDNG